MIPLDRIVLGSAVFGMPWYGYGSTSHPTAEESIAIIKAARRAGICRFDTALGYGDALALLEYAGVPQKEIIVKARLPLPSRDMVHNPTLDELAGLSRGFGVSVYTVAEVLEAKRLGLRPIQAPASCLNAPVNVEYGRAPFLQGILLRAPERAPEGLRHVVADFQALARRLGVSSTALALASAYGDRIVVGISSESQLDELLQACMVEVSPGMILTARIFGQTTDATAALPSLWSNA